MSTQTGFDHAEAAGFTPAINLDDVAPGTTFQATWGYTNMGTTTWDGRYRFTYTLTPHPETAANPRSPMGTQMAFALTDLGAPDTVPPGATVQLTITFTAPATAATHATNWQLQAPDGQRFGPVRWLRAVVKETKAAETAGETADFTPDNWRSAIFAITNIFESGTPDGRVDAYQNVDAGIVSYGKHQATLQSGNLERVLNAYFPRSNSATSQALQQEYAGRVQRKEETLRHDARFKQLLLAAAAEPEMSQAQDEVFDNRFYTTVAARASQLGVKTPLGLAC
ncbi:MAG: NBR1-Ig-like domain-containing protein, partial [Chloroflexota bacterium]